MIKYIIVPLSQLISSEEFSEDFLTQSFYNFKCENEVDLEEFLHYKAIGREKLTKSSTYLFLDEEKFLNREIEVLAYVSHGITSVEVSELTSKQRKRMFGDTVDKRDERTSLPTYLIGQLGRSDKYTNRDLPGNTILYESIIILKTMSTGAGGDVAILECRPHMFDKFYRKYGFKLFPSSHEEDGEGFKMGILKCLVNGFKKVEFLGYMKNRFGNHGKDVAEEFHGKFGVVPNLDFDILTNATHEFARRRNLEIADMPELLTLHCRLSKFEFQ